MEPDRKSLNASDMPQVTGAARSLPAQAVGESSAESTAAAKSGMRISW